MHTTASPRHACATHRSASVHAFSSSHDVPSGRVAQNGKQVSVAVTESEQMPSDTVSISWTGPTAAQRKAVVRDDGLVNVPLGALHMYVSWLPSRSTTS